MPIIDINPRATPGLKQELAEEAENYAVSGIGIARTSSVERRTQRGERVNGGLKGQPTAGEIRAGAG